MVLSHENSTGGGRFEDAVGRADGKGGLPRRESAGVVPVPRDVRQGQRSRSVQASRHKFRYPTLVPTFLFRERESSCAAKHVYNDEVLSAEYIRR